MKNVILALILLVLLASTVSATLEITGEQLIIVGEDSPVNDVLTGITIVQFLKGAGYDAPMGSALLDKDAYEEFTASMMDDFVFYVIDDKEIDVLLGDDISANNVWIAEQAAAFMEEEGFSVEIIDSPTRDDLLVTYEPASEEENEAADEEPVACAMDAKACPDGTFVGRIAPDCEFEKCPEYAPVDPDEKPEDAHADTCAGCLLGGECISYGAVLEGQRYCADDGIISAQKDDGSSCSENVECKTACNGEICQKVKPVSKNPIVRFFSWIGSIFR